MPVNRGTVKETIIVNGRLLLRSTLIIGGIISFILAAIFLFIPIDGPFGEIAFGSIGVFLIFLGVGSGSPAVAEANRALKSGRAAESAIKRFKGRRGR